MAYGTIKVDNITFDNGGVDKLITVSGLFYSTSGALTVTGTISGGNVTAPTATFTTLTGTTTTGTTATFTSGSFTTLTGTTVTGTTANFVSGVFTTQVSGTTITGTTVATTTGSFVSLTGTTATFTSGIIASGTAALPSLAILSDPNTGIYSPGADQLAISTNGTGRLFIDSAGLVGINQASPGSALDVNGEIRIYPSSGAGNLRFGSGGVEKGKVAVDASSNYTVETAGSERLRITSAGLVGVGTSSPSGNLDVRGVSGTSIIRAVGADTNGNADAEIFSTGTTGNSRLYFSDTAAQSGSIIYSHSTNLFSLATNATTAVTIDSSQRVGVGTTSPSELLHVAGNTRIGANDTSSALLEVGAGATGNRFALIDLVGDTTYTDYGLRIIRGNTGANTASQIIHQGTGSFTLQALAAAPITFETSSLERLRITSAGLVGIGTSSPSVRLQVQDSIAGGSGGTVATLHNASDTGGDTRYSGLNFVIGSDNGTSAIRAARTNSSTNYETNLSFWTNPAGATQTPVQRMTLDSTGRLGIGTTSPAAKLEIQDGSISVGSSANTSQTNTLIAGYGYIIGSTKYGNTSIRSTYSNATNSANLEFYIGSGSTGTAEAMRLDTGGRLLVGTSSARSTIGFDNTPQLQIEGTTVNSSAASIVSNADNAGAPYLFLAKSRGGSVGSNTIVQSGDGLGYINWSGNDGSQFEVAAYIGCEVDGTPGANDMPGRLVFSTTADGAASPTERMRIDSSGNIGIGATPVAWGANFKALQLAPWTSLVGNNNNGAVHLTCNAYYAGSGGGTLTYIGTGGATSYTQLPGSHFWSIASSGTAGTAITFTQAMTLDSSGRWYVGTSTDGGADGFTIYPAGSGAGSAAIGVWNKTNTALEAAAQFRVSGTTIGSISYSNTLVAYNTTSDYRLKENVTPITNGITRFQQLKPSKFNFIVEPDKTVEGFLAHEAQAVVPECVTGEKDAVDADGNPVYQGIDQSKLVPLLTAALQEAIARIETLEVRLTAAGIE